MDTVMDMGMDMLMVTHGEVMGMENRVSPGTSFLKKHLACLRIPSCYGSWVGGDFPFEDIFGDLCSPLLPTSTLRASFKGETELRGRRKGSRWASEEERRKHRAQRWPGETSEF